MPSNAAATAIQMARSRSDTGEYLIYTAYSTMDRTAGVVRLFGISTGVRLAVAAHPRVGPAVIAGSMAVWAGSGDAPDLTETVWYRDVCNMFQNDLGFGPITALTTTGTDRVTHLDFDGTTVAVETARTGVSFHTLSGVHTRWFEGSHSGSVSGNVGAFVDSYGQVTLLDLDTGDLEMLPLAARAVRISGDWLYRVADSALYAHHLPSGSSALVSEGVSAQSFDADAEFVSYAKSVDGGAQRAFIAELALTR